MQISAQQTTSIPSALKLSEQKKVVGACAAFLFGVLLFPTLLLAQPPQTPEETDKETIRALLRRVEQLEARVTQLEASRQPRRVPASGLS